jgi:hypothetical protein
MKIHPDSPAPKSQVKRVATLIGLDQIDYGVTYSLVKIGAKKESSLGYPDAMVAIKEGEFELVGVNTDEGCLVWLVGYESLGFNWFKTSPVKSCKKIKNGFRIETENSFYELRKV